MELLEHITGACGEHWHLNINQVLVFSISIYILNEIKRIRRYNRKVH